MAKPALPDHIDSIYPLSPMQEGMLFHTLMNPGTGIYLMQNRYLLEGDLNYDAFVRAWDVVLDRHPVLRTSFVWKNQKRPLQAVHKRVDVPIVPLDWRGQTRPEQIARLDAELEAELREGFDFAKAPLMRLWLIRLADDRYQFVHSFHHILLDEWCISLLLMDFLGHYGSLVRGEGFAREKPRPYRDYIAWLQKQDINAAESFWRGYLKNFPTPTPLPYDRLPEGLADQNEDAADHCLYLSVDTSARLVDLAQRHRLTVNTFFQGAWALLLNYYSSEREVLFGVTVAGRPTELSGVESILGLFINTLPLRISMQPDRPLMDWLKDLLAENVRVRQYDYAPLVQIQRWSEVPRGEALFHSLFVFENAPVDRELCEGRIIFKGEEEQYRVHTNYPLTVMGWPGRELGLKISYDKRLFDADTTDRMIRHFKTLLEAMAERPTARLADLSPLKQDERRQLLTEWNPHVEATGEEQSESLPRLFEERVKCRPDAVAVEYLEEKATYRELNRRANRVAHVLTEAGVGSDTIVALLDDRGIDLLTMVVGVFKAGGAYLPLDPHHPVSRLTQILKLSRSPVVLTSQDYLGRLQEAVVQIDKASRPRLMSIERIFEGAGREDNPEGRGRSEHLAYVIYTSGSTGVPKGAMVTRRGMLNNIRSKVSGLALGPSDVIAQTASQCFDISVWQFLTALTCGARTNIVPDETSRDPFHLLAHLERTDITILETVPALLQGLLDAMSEAGSGVEPRLQRRLRWVLPTGEALPPSVCRQWLARYPMIPLLNAYGPAECADDVAVHPILEPPAADQTHMPIGRPIERTRLHILNAWLEPVPPGVPGELYVAGVGVGRGYLQDPARTAEVFLPDRFGSEPGVRMYRTGDLARYRRDGALEFVGRVDQQIKLRGFRIELGEIETHLLASSLVREAAVLLHTDARGEKRLAAYFVGHEQGDPGVPALRELLQAQLPEYMVPTALVPLPVLPRTPNGKIDRLALAALDLGDQFDRPYTAPRTATEEILAGIWSEVLGVERVGIHDDFFELGGHSLLATQIMSRIRGTFHLELSLRTVFESTSVAALAATVERARQDNAAAGQAPPLEPISRTGLLPTSFAQQRLWFLAQLEPEGWSYNLPFGIRIKGPVDPSVLQRCFAEVTQRHESLRTIFVVREQDPVQEVAPHVTVDLPVANLTGLPKEKREQAVRRLADEHARIVFDLSRGPLWRVNLLHVRAGEYVLLLTLHHVIADGWSMNILLQEVLSLYASFVSGEPSALKPLRLQYADYAQWQRLWLQGSVLDQQLGYWKNILAGAPTVLSLPTDRPRPSVERHRGARLEFTLPPALLDRLQAMSRRHGVTLFMTLLAAFQMLLFRHTGESDLCIGTPIAGRTRLETESLIGLFVNTLVLRTDVSDVERFVDLLERVRDVVLEAQAHQDLPFEYLVDALQPARDLSRSPLFQVMFALQTLPGNDVGVPGIEISSYDVDPGSAKFDLSLEMTLEPGGLHGFFEYNSDLFDVETIRRLETHYRHVLDQVVAQPNQRLSAIEVLGAGERRQVVEEWNATQRRYPRTTVPELIYEQVQGTPQAVAVRLDDQTLSYDALWRRSAAMAAQLRRQGVGPDVLVGLCAERSLELVIGLLGIVQAGGAYVPIDPSYPAERIAYMLADAAPSVLLTQPALRGQLPPFAGVCLDLSAMTPEASDPANFPPTPVRLDQLAYTIYTSGSTGRPKGAGNTHGGLLNRLQWMQDYFGLTPADRVLQKTPFSFDVSVWEFLWPLMTGAELVLALPEEHKDGLRLKERIVTQQITTMHFVPPMLQAFLEMPGVEACASTLRRVICSGEALSDTVQRQCWARLPGVDLHNLYGPTEAAIDVTVWSCDPTAPADPVPIGRPIANTQIYILDHRGEPVPIGVPGEVHIGGVNVARGYHRWPALTAERFVPDAFSAEPGRRLYRTGDLARYRPDGAIEYLGRLDHQVKIRGVRIELGEIESCLHQHPAVHEAVVVAQDTAAGTKRLVGYVVPRSGHEVSGEALRQWVGARLPEAFVPSVVLPLDALPLTPNGKVDRKALPVPDLLARTQAYEEPRTESERVLAAIWAKVLGQPRVGRLDNFFELGGDSILSLQIIARAKQAGLVLTPRQLFQYQTPAELAEIAMREAAQTEAGLIMFPPEQGPVTGDVPLTPVQHWFFEQSFVDPHRWNQSILLEVKQPLNHQALVKAMQDLVHHHDMLRARFDRTEHDWRQWVEPEANVDVHCVDLSTWSTNEFIKQFEELAERWQTRLHLTNGPLLRVVWFDRGPRETGRLLIVVHHLVMDGVSWRVLLEDLQQVYLQRLHGQTPQLAAKTTSFQQWAVRLTEHAQSDALSTEAAYWLNETSAPVQPLPVDEPDGMRTETSVEAVTVTLESEQTRALLYDVAGAYHTRIEDLLLTALARTIAGWTGCAETLVDVEWHGREDLFPDLDVSRTVGWFTAIHPMLLRVEGQGAGDDVKSIKEQLRRIPGRGVGYGVLRYLLKSGPEAALRRRSGSELCFNYFGQLDRALAERSMFDLAQESVGKEHGPANRLPYELTVNAEVLRDRLSLTWSYSGNRYRRTTIERLGRTYLNHLQDLITHCTSSDAGGYTPSDFPDVEIGQDALDTILERMDESHAR